MHPATVELIWTIKEWLPDTPADAHIKYGNVILIVLTGGIMLYTKDYLIDVNKFRIRTYLRGSYVCVNTPAEFSADHLHSIIQSIHDAPSDVQIFIGDLASNRIFELLD